MSTIKMQFDAELEDAEDFPAPRTQRYFSSMGQFEARPALYASMFQEDISNSVVPYSLSSNKETPFAILVGEESALAMARTLLSSLGERTRKIEDSELILEAIRHIASAIAEEGICNFEIIRSTRGKGTVLSYFPSRNTYWMPFVSVQVIKGTKQNGEPNSRIIWLSNSEIWRFEFPSALGRRNAYRKVLRQLESCSEIGPKFFLESMNAGRTAALFDHRIYHRMQNIGRGIASREWGWPQRNSNLEGITEYYYIERSLRFAKSMALVREHLVKQLNKLFSHLNILVSIELQGIASSEKIEDSIQRMSNGTLDFTAASSILYPSS